MQALTTSESKKKQQPGGRGHNPAFEDHRSQTNRLIELHESLGRHNKLSPGELMQQAINEKRKQEGNTVKPFAALAEAALTYIPQQDRQAVQQLIQFLKTADPKSMFQLTEVSNKANKVYESFDFRLKEHNEEAWTYQTNLDNWRYQLQIAIYQRRDELIKQQPERLLQFGLEKQFKKMHPDMDVPACLVNTQKQLGVVLFGGKVENDCGRFATKLFNELRTRALLALEEEGSTGKQMLNHPAISDLHNDVLTYFKSATFPYPHHAKTAIGSDKGKIYSLEAHKGKPFILAPELREFNSLDDYLESNDVYIEKRATKNLLSEMGIKDVDQYTDEYIMKLLKGSFMHEIIEPLGKR
ncbi:hypothetical protein GCM10028818_33030 [Spirosoma horti]